MTLREARFFKGLNQWDISIKTGIPQSKLSLIERGYVDPRKDEKRKIAKVLGCKVVEVFPESARA
jgi:ribosome-binding protein aMBF1 (putative translation factor)